MPTPTKSTRKVTGWLSATATTKRGTLQRFYGGKLTENIVQALARDVFAEHVLNIGSAGLRVLWTVHDEAVIEVPDEDVADAEATIMDIMSTPPVWAPELPLSCEIAKSKHFDK